MTDLYDQMREAPDPRLADALRARLHSRLDSELMQFDDPIGPAPSSTARDAIQHRIDEPPSTSRRWLMVAAAVAALALVGGLIFAETRADEEPVPADQPESTLSYQWSRVAHDEAVFGGERNQLMKSVTAGGPGLVAVGTEWGAGLVAPQAWGDDPDSVAAVWTSVDGLTWSRVPHDEDLFADAVMNDVTPGGPGLVAVGWSYQPEETGSGYESEAAVWTSVDGLTWSRVHDETFATTSIPEPTSKLMNSVVVGGPGLVAVGREGGAAAAVWTSVDGLTWTRVPHDREIFGSPTALGFGMISVTAGGPGLVAVGAWPEAPRISAKVWTSVDGLTWTRVPDDEAGFDEGQVPLSVTAGGPGLVAVGLGGAGAGVFTSVDGFHWVQVPDDEAIFSATYGSDSAPDSRVYQPPPEGAGLAMNEVIAVGDGLVAVGGPTYNYRGPRDGDLGAAVWTSPDGITWSRVPHDTAVFGGTGENSIWSVTTAGSNLVAVGSHQHSIEIDANAAAWVATTS
jgi:hypothetical protein